MEKKKTGRPSACGSCGKCAKCAHAAYMRDYYHSKSQKERRRIFVEGRDKEREREADRRRYHEDPDRRSYVAEKTRKWKLENPGPKEAQAIVSNAKKSGELVQPDHCEINNKECYGMLNAHHDDYSKPLEVRWLCRSHHMKWHAENGPGKR